MIRITSKQEGFRRAGMSHTNEPKEYPDNKFSPEQLAALKAEPMLIVEVVEEPKAPSVKEKKPEEKPPFDKLKTPQGKGLPVRCTQTGKKQ